MASLLISEGAMVNTKDGKGYTPLHLAAEKDQADLAVLLISKGADINMKTRYEGETALKVATGKTKILLHLINSGIDVNLALEASKNCKSLKDAKKYITPSALKLAADNVTSNMTPKYSGEESDQDVILPAIVDAKEFKSLLKQGTYESYGNRIYLAGACSVGKSTLASLLIGDEIPLEWKSTDGLKIFFGRNAIHLEEKKMFPLPKNKDTSIFSSVLRGQPDMGKSHSDIPESQHDAEISQLEENSSMSKFDNNNICQKQSIPESTVVESTQSELPAAHSMSYVPEKHAIITETSKVQEKEKPVQKRIRFNLIHEGIKQEIKKGEYRVKIVPSDLVDFGGQRSYDMTHQLFIQGKGTFTLLFDGRKGLNVLLSEYPQGNVTTASIVKHWVDSILTYCGEDDDDILPVILFVATHRDALNSDEQLKMMAEFKQGLKEMFQSHERASRIKYRDIFFINGTDKNDPEVMRLQATYVEIAFQQKSWGKRMPMAWVPLELQMSEMRADNLSIISKDDLIKINKENDDLKLSNKQLDDFLRVQHALGKIIYFESQELEKFVIVQPTSLVDILRSFITDEMFFPPDTTLRHILSEMTKTGKIRKEDLFKLWKQDEFNQHMPDDNFKDFVVKVLIHLDLLIEPKRYSAGGNVGEVYLVPCIIKKEPPTNFCEGLKQNQTLYLSYKLLKSSIPSAMSFKIIGSVLNVWPLKETGAGGVCLYNKAAILHIDHLNELYLLVRYNRIVVCLHNTTSRQFISPDIASCIQECLTLTIEKTLMFYHSSFGKLVSTLEVQNLFKIEVGEKCKGEICYLPLPEAKCSLSWKCMEGKDHTTKYSSYWTFDKVQVCKPDCIGLDQESLKLCPEYKHLARLAINVGINEFPAFVISLGLSKVDWDAFQYKHQGANVNMMKIEALCAWKNHMDNPSFQDLQNAITEIGYDCHKLCQIFREDRTFYGIDHPLLQTVPDDKTLRDLSTNIGNCAIRLGIELDVPDTEIENTTSRYSKNIFQQNYDILIKWKNKYGKTNGTIRNLMRVLHEVDNRGCKFLRERYKIKY